ncbi:MAG: EipA family protein [Pseudomonadota bacterium]
MTNKQPSKRALSADNITPKSDSLVASSVRLFAAIVAVAMLALAPALTSVGAQDVQSFDPDEAYSTPDNSIDTAESAGGDGDRAIDADLVDPSAADSWSVAPQIAPPIGSPASTQQAENESAPDMDPTTQAAVDGASTVDSATGEQIAAGQVSSATYGEDDLIGAAEGLFGKGAEGLGGMIEGLLREQGEPNGYIVGREAGGAFVFGARYGSGTLYHKVEGQRPVYWTGPSLGVDAGANAGNTFVLVYNLYDSEDLYRRYPAGEGQAYFVGGLHASYMRRGDVVLIPIRMGAGLRLGVNAGYMRFSKKQRWLPF